MSTGERYDDRYGSRYALLETTQGSEWVRDVWRAQRPPEPGRALVVVVLTMSHWLDPATCPFLAVPSPGHARAFGEPAATASERFAEAAWQEHRRSLERMGALRG